MSKVVNVKPIGAYADEFRIFAIAEALDSGVKKMFSFVGAMPDKSLSINMNPILGKDKNTNDIFVSNGNYGASTTAQQMVVEGDFSFSLNKDFNTEINELDPRVCKDILQAIISGEKFTFDSVEWIVVGVNGQRYIGDLTTTDMRYFFELEGKLAIPNAWGSTGKKLTQDNGKVAPFADTALVGFEMTGLFGTSTRRGYRIPYSFETEKMFNQDESADNYSTTMKRLSDVTQTAGSIYDVMTDAETLDTGATDELERIEADYIVEIAGGGTPTFAGTAGDQIVVVNVTDNTIELYKHDGTDFITTVVTSELASGAVIRGAKYDTLLDCSTATDKVTLVACKTAGATEVATAVEVGTGTCALELMDFDYQTATFVNYEG